jgi:hypothetical protein
MVAALSALTIAFVGLFALAPTQTAMAASSGSRTIAGQKVVFYGKATNAHHKPLRHARVVVYHYTHHRQHIDKVVRTNRRGVYKVRKYGAHGRYYVQISRRVHGKFLKLHTHFNVRPGHAYRVSVRIVKKSLFAFLPVTHY